MLCSKCVLHVLKALTKIEGIQELKVDLDKKSIKIIFDDDNLTKEIVAAMVYDAVEGIRPGRLSPIN